MRKKISLIAVLLTVSCVVYAGVAIRAKIGPFNAKNTAITTIAAAGTGYRNCLTHLDVKADNSIATLDVLDGGTTIYSMDFSSGSALIKEWPIENFFCGSMNTAMSIKVTTATETAVWNVNYLGFIY